MKKGPLSGAFCFCTVGSQAACRTGGRDDAASAANLEAAQPGRVIVDLAGQDHLVGAIGLDQTRQLVADALAVAHGTDAQRTVDGLAHLRADLGVDVADRARQLAGLAGPQAREGQLHRRAQIGGLSGVVGGKDVRRQHRIGLLPPGRGAEPFAIDAQRLFQLFGGEMACKGIGQAQMRRQLRAEQAAAQDPDGDVRPLSGQRADGRARAFRPR